MPPKSANSPALPPACDSPDRINYRNGFRERGWETRVGRIELAVPKLRKGSYFPGFLEAAPHGEGADGGASDGGGAGAR
jgi:putative transposase